MNKNNPVSFIEAVKSGKRIRIKHKNIVDYGYYRLDILLSAIVENCISEQEIRDIILNGKCYIQEEEE